MLEVQGLKAMRKDRLVLPDVSLRVDAQEAVALVGPNGAGKSTLLRTLSGINPTAAGTTRFRGELISGHEPREIVERGLIHIPEGRQLFPDLSVRENLFLGGFLLPKAERERAIEETFTRFPKLAERSEQLAGSLSGGEQQILAIARGLIGKPSMLLLDEPTIGLSPLMIETVAEIVAQVHGRGIGLLLVDQNVALARMLTTRAYVLVTGRIVAEGPTAAILTEDQLSRSYLGGLQQPAAA
jgi:branched-chain amino acid transport system ATP-binding protein